VKLLKIKNQKGQSTIEFALTLILVMVFILFFVQLSLVFGFGNYVHYSTYMSARALLSSGFDDEQSDKARDVLIKMLKNPNNPGSDRFSGIGQGIGDGELKGAKIGNSEQFESNFGDPAFSWMQGVRYRFRSKLFMIPLGNDPRANSIELESESWLGREPSFLECQKIVRGIIDNGC